MREVSLAENRVKITSWRITHLLQLRCLRVQRRSLARIGDRVCTIGGFDQFHFLTDTTANRTRAAVRRCFEEAGAGGGYILSPSDHFFDAEPALVAAFAEEAGRCTYGN